MTILTQEELAKVLKVSRSFIRREYAAGNIPGFAVNPASKRPLIRFDLEEVIAALRRRSQPGRSLPLPPIRKLRWLGTRPPT